MQGTSGHLPFNARNEIVNLFNVGLGLSDISRNTRVPKGAVHKTVRHYSVQINVEKILSPRDDSTIFLFSCGG